MPVQLQAKFEAIAIISAHHNGTSSLTKASAVQVISRSINDAKLGGAGFLLFLPRPQLNLSDREAL